MLSFLASEYLENLHQKECKQKEIALSRSEAIKVASLLLQIFIFQVCETFKHLALHICGNKIRE
jgi:hypothetical protein